MNENELRARLVHWLEGKAALVDDKWSRAFGVVPRHVFVRRFWYRSRLGAEGWIELCADDAEQHPEWLEVAYTDRALFIPSEEEGGSSSSMPSIMAHMLESLRVQDGLDVLEIGTGSGYQAALLSERLGSDHVTTIDIDSIVVKEARARLAEIGHWPNAVLGDGLHGYSPGAPYDRLIGTCYAWPIPSAWVEQVRPGGVVVAIAPSSMVALDVDESGRASGMLHPETFGFMPMRGYMQWPTQDEFYGAVGAKAPIQSPRLPIEIVDAGGQQRSFWVLISMLVLPSEVIGRLPGGVTAWYDPRDGSWLRLDRQRQAVAQGGPRRLWDEVERLYELWSALGAPNRERFGLTVDPDGTHTLWLDDPESEHRWTVVPPRQD